MHDRAKDLEPTIVAGNTDVYALDLDIDPNLLMRLCSLLDDEESFLHDRYVCHDLKTLFAEPRPAYETLNALADRLGIVKAERPAEAGRGDLQTRPGVDEYYHLESEIRDADPSYARLAPHPRFAGSLLFTLTQFLGRWNPRGDELKRDG